LSDLLKNHKQIAKDLKPYVKNPIKHFDNYLKYGAYPYYLENKNSYALKLSQTINLILEVDLNAVENMAYQDSRRIKKLLVAIAQSAENIKANTRR